VAGSFRCARITSAMLGIDRRAARYVWTAVVVVLLLCLIYLVRKTLFVFVIALLLAYLLSPLVQLFDRFLPGKRTRPPALALAYIIFLGLIGLIGSQIGTQVVEQGHELQKRFPDLLKPAEQPNPSQPEAVNSLKAQVITRVRAAIVENSS